MQVQNLCLKPDSLADNPVDFDYSMFKQHGFELDSELLKKFQDVAKKINLTSDALKMLLEIALEMSIKQKTLYEKDEVEKQKENVAKYSKMFEDDSTLPDLDSTDVKKYMGLANQAYNQFVNPNLMQIFEAAGLNYHPELIKMFYKIGELIKDDTLPYPKKPSFKELSPAQILYGKQSEND